MTNVEKFFEQVKTDKALAEKLNAAQKDYAGDKNTLKGTGDREAAAKAVLLPIAEEAGLSFTIDELKAYEGKLPKKEDGAELSADELKAVAGGLDVCICWGKDDDGDWCIILGDF